MGFDEDGSVRCALGHSYLFEDSSGAQERAFAKEVLGRPYAFGAGLMQFLLTIARGTYALPLPALRKARRFARDDDRDVSPSSPAAPNGGEGSGDSGSANGGTVLSDTPFSDRLKFSTRTCNMQWQYSDRKVSPRARVGEHTILVSIFLIPPCFRAVCRCAQGKRHLVGEEAHVKLIKDKKKSKLKDEFASELVWLPVVVTVRGDLTTYDQPGDSFLRVTYLDKFGDDPAQRHPGWLTDKAYLTAEPAREVSVACDEQFQVDGKIQLAVGRPRRDVDHDAKLGLCGHRWTPHAAVSVVVFVHGRLRSRRLTPPPPFHPPCRAPFADVQGGGV